MRRLPLRSIEAFVVVARLLNLTRAAAEMGLTVPALSRRISLLEQEFGTALFRRLPRGLALTEAGDAYAAALAPAWAAMAQATEAARARMPRRRVTVTTLPTFAANWLVPRLDRFQARHPEIEVGIETSIDLVDLRRRPDLDGAIRLGEGPWAGHAADSLLPIDAYPVASPGYLAGHAPVTSPRALLRHVLIDSNHRPEFWPEWFRAADIDAADCRRRGFDNLQLVHEAAAAGLGVAIGLGPLLQPYLDSGRLRRVLPGGVRLSRGFHLVRRADDAPANRAFDAFRDWLLAEAADAGLRFAETSSARN
jgi:LysR family glycine cleavage system transcriptional activator